MHPDKDFFGYIPRSSMPVTISRGMHLTLDDSMGNAKASTLQRGWLWWEPKNAEVRRVFGIRSEPAY